MKQLKIGTGLWALCLFMACDTSFEEPKISLKGYHIQEGFALEVIASEPHLKAPVAMDFDDRGRIWAVQMPGYMNDMQGSDEKRPIGSIVILEDRDADGITDHTKVFLDSLVMPRALSHVYGGLLYAEPPNLWFVDIEDDEPGQRVLVDSLYAGEGNPEHQPNGLLLNIDNWIYNAKSNFRYRRKNGIWVKEPTTFRGQWGISHDNFGRLYYNDNSRQLLGDYVLPNRLARNKHFSPMAGVNQMLTKDQRVYPLHATTVNRGYAKGVLDKDSVLVNTTAACAPLVYRGGMFSEEYAENVFVCIPEGNLIKRNILSFMGDSTIAEQAYMGKEFLASTDEGFRPVNLNNGPDGSLYIVDMHRGMIGHHAYLSPYLKKKVKGNRLDTVTDFGRILKVSQLAQMKMETPDFETMGTRGLIRLLRHKNGWIRDRAQRLLIHSGDLGAIPELRETALNTRYPLAQIHALYVLEGMDALNFDFLAGLAKGSIAKVSAHALILLEQFIVTEYRTRAVGLFDALISKNDTGLDLYLSATLGKWMTVGEGQFLEQMMTVYDRHSGSSLFVTAIISGLVEDETIVLNYLEGMGQNGDSLLGTQLSLAAVNRKMGKMNPIFTRNSLTEDTRTHGAKLFQDICASCHGINGQGIQGLAPPLMNSEHVADPERLALIVLHGLEGPVTVNGKRYDFNLAMPGLIRNENISDKDISDIIAYVTNAFSDMPKNLKPQEIKVLREMESKSGAEFTEAELLENSK
ncbi:MAG: c-type cytochrome [Bacteroidota bacterium]